MRMRAPAYFLALLAVCAGTHAFNPLHEVQTELKEQIKAIDESPWYVRLTNWYSRRSLRRLQTETTSLSASLYKIMDDIAKETVTSAPQALNNFRADYCDGTSPKTSTVDKISNWLHSNLGQSLTNAVGLTRAQIGYDGMITDFLQNCVCSSHWELNQPEVSQLWATVVALAKNSDATKTNAEKRADLIAKIKAAGPIVFGATSLCGTQCETAFVNFCNTFIALVPKIVLSSSVTSSGANALGKWGPGSAGLPSSISLPADSKAQARLGKQFYDCICSGWDHGAIAEAVFQVPWYAIFGGSIWNAWRGIAEGSIAGGSPWIAKSMADDVVYWSTYYNSRNWTFFASFSTEHDPERVLKAAIPNFNTIRSSICASGCLPFFVDTATLALQTALQYYW